MSVPQTVLDNMDQPEYPLFVINAFTKTPFSGNPAAVCLVKKNQEPSDELKQKLATEINVSETAYVLTINEKDEFATASRFRLRWFTPVTEVKLCGHATLASSAVLFNHLGNSNQTITFDTQCGELIVRKTADGKFCMDFPNNKPVALNEEEIKNLIKVAVGTLPYQDVKYCPNLQYLLIRLEDNVNNLQFQNHKAPMNLMLQAHNGEKILGVILTLKGSSENGYISEDGTVYDFVSRFLDPWTSVHDEDPVTGSAHTVLAPYWAEILNKKQLFACQCSSRRGLLWLDISDDGRIQITGEVFAFIKGSVHIQ